MYSVQSHINKQAFSAHLTTKITRLQFFYLLVLQFDAFFLSFDKFGWIVSLITERPHLLTNVLPTVYFG